MVICVSYLRLSCLLQVLDLFIDLKFKYLINQWFATFVLWFFCVLPADLPTKNHLLFTIEPMRNSQFMIEVARF